MKKDGDKERKKKIINIYLSVIILVLSVCFMMILFCNYYGSYHNVDLAFNGLKDENKLSMIIDYYEINKTTKEPISQPLVNFYIDGMKFFSRAPLLIFLNGFLFGMSLTILIFYLLNPEAKEVEVKNRRATRNISNISRTSRQEISR